MIKVERKKMSRENMKRKQRKKRKHWEKKIKIQLKSWKREDVEKEREK